MLALDTNILARYYYSGPADDDPQTGLQREAARRIIEGGSALFVPKTVLLELEWVLRGVYDRSAGNIADALITPPAGRARRFSRSMPSASRPKRAASRSRLQFASTARPTATRHALIR